MFPKLETEFPAGFEECMMKVYLPSSFRWWWCGVVSW